MSRNQKDLQDAIIEIKKLRKDFMKMFLFLEQMTHLMNL